MTLYSTVLLVWEVIFLVARFPETKSQRIIGEDAWIILTRDKMRPHVRLLGESGDRGGPKKKRSSDTGEPSSGREGAHCVTICPGRCRPVSRRHAGPAPVGYPARTKREKG